MTQARKADEWLQGYAAALSTVYRVTGINTAVEQALICDGLTLADLERAGADEFDLDGVRRALPPRS